MPCCSSRDAPRQILRQPRSPAAHRERIRLRSCIRELGCSRGRGDPISGLARGHPHGGDDQPASPSADDAVPDAARQVDRPAGGEDVRRPVHPDRGARAGAAVPSPRRGRRLRQRKHRGRPRSPRHGRGFRGRLRRRRKRRRNRLAGPARKIAGSGSRGRRDRSGRRVLRTEARRFLVRDPLQGRPRGDFALDEQRRRADLGADGRGTQSDHPGHRCCALFGLLPAGPPRNGASRCLRVRGSPVVGHESRSCSWRSPAR
ncbi:hypothetical protein ACFPRL_17370 [Pseudoclavibacter helvolus]